MSNPRQVKEIQRRLKSYSKGDRNLKSLSSAIGESVSALNKATKSVIRIIKKDEKPNNFTNLKKTKSIRAKIKRVRIEKVAELKPKKKRRFLNNKWKAEHRIIGGKRCFFRSSWEANYARILQLWKDDEKIVEWEHEPDTFWFDKIKRGVRSYLPDFKVWLNDGTIVYYEVKGYMDKKSATKVKRMKLYYPKIILIVIDQNWYKTNGQKYRLLIADWE
jgi:hypothetical protein